MQPGRDETASRLSLRRNKIPGVELNQQKDRIRIRGRLIREADNLTEAGEQRYRPGGRTMTNQQMINILIEHIRAADAKNADTVSLRVEEV